MRVICDRCGNVVAEGSQGSTCTAQLKVPGVGFKVCGGTMLGWKAGVIPGISNERGKYDAQCESVFASLNSPRLVLLFVVGGPQGEGLSVSGDAAAIASIPGVFRNLAERIEAMLQAVQS